MKKLERLDGKLFEALQKNEMTKMSHLIGGYETEQTLNGGDTRYLYKSWGNTRDGNGVHKDNERTDDEKVVQTNGGSGTVSSYYDSFNVTESLSEDGGIIE
jgi:hypothetical protein